MKYEIYCDESCQDVFTSQNSQCRYMFIGGLWLLADKRESLKDKFHAIRVKHKMFSEIKWNKVSASKVDFYIDLINYFFDKNNDTCFRCVVVEKSKVNLVKYHDADAELGFYKFYYQLLHHWILDFNTYAIYLDIKTSRVKNRLKILHQCLNRANLSSEIKILQALPSHENIFIQIADLLLGAVNAKFNGQVSGEAKQKIVECIESRLGHKITATSKGYPKFNIFQIDLAGEKI
ncbi:MAG: DUF3800 domain-containing protein [Candidatus Omnitrophota bacterium]